MQSDIAVSSSIEHHFPFKTFSLSALDSSDQKTDEQFAQMLKEGFFYLEMPQKCRELIGKGLEFGNSFYQSETVKSAKLAGFGGYRDDDKIQKESYYAERSDWDRLVQEGIYSQELVQLAREMNALGLEVLKKALYLLQIPQENWETLTGELSSDKGSHHFSFNHYRAERNLPGLQAHRDFGYVTVLFIDKLGLEGNVNGNWVDVPPLKDHFIINFGRCLEILTDNDGRVNAIEHRVRKVSEDRISFGMFLDGNPALPVYSFNQKTQNQEKKFDSYQVYFERSFEESYR